MKPNFFLIGAPKCATTSWASYLSQHPQISFSEIKEPQYFCSDLRSKYHPAIDDDQAYEALFPDGENFKAAGEATPIYLCSEDAPSRIQAYAPDAKIIILLRRQAGFIWSLHQQFLYRRIEIIENPAEAWATCDQRNAEDYDEPDQSLKLLNYRAMADFEAQVGRVLDLFPAQQIFVSWMEDWKTDPDWLWTALCRFLDVDATDPPEFKSENSAKFHRSGLISKLTNRPPKFVLAMARAIRKLTGSSRLGLAEQLRNANKIDGYKYPLTEELDREIMNIYTDGNTRLNQRLNDLGCLYAPNISAAES